MFKTGRYYIAINNDAAPDIADNWFPVLCEDADQNKWRKMGSTHEYKLSDFAQVRPNDIVTTYRVANDLKTMLRDNKPKITIRLETDNAVLTTLLNILHTLKEDFEGYAQLTDSDRQHKVMQVYALMHKLETP